jgi:nucleotide-binding universal stress UspA family protein
MKDILVHMDGGEHAVHRLDIAISLAKRFGARLLGLFAQTETDEPSLVARRASGRLQAAATQAAAEFTRRAEAAGLQHKWWQLSHGEPGHVVNETAFCARYADLVVVGQWPQESAMVPEEFVEQVVLRSGRPVLVLPHVGVPATLGERVSIAWNASREATRALHDALPFLERAELVNILAIRESGQATTMSQVPQVDIVDHLTSRGIKAKAERLTAEDIGIMDMLLSRTFDLGSDLLVMGAHSGIGLPFGMRRGSGTHFILRHLTIPVLMSN